MREGVSEGGREGLTSVPDINASSSSILRLLEDSMATQRHMTTHTLYYQ